jgi:hypothetical protein
MSRTPLTVTQRPRQPLFPDRILNFLGRLRKPIPPDPTELMAAAATATGLEDFGPDDFLPALEVYCRALNRDEQLSYLGRYAARRMDTKLLADRLLIQETLKKDPDIAREEIKAPILIFGNPRSGTTLLQRLLAQDPRFRVMLAWESYFGTSPPQPSSYQDNPQIRQTEGLLGLVAKSSPAIFVAHPMAPKLPEECWFLLERQFIRPLYSFFLEIPDYWDWLLDRSWDDLARDLLYYRLQLQILQRPFGETRWVLKSPVHAHFLIPFSRVFPDMRFVECHRDPVRALPSLCSLGAARKAGYYSFIDFKALGQKAFGTWDVGLTRIMNARAELGEERFSDVSFSRLMEDPIHAVEELYGSLGLELSSEAREKMAQFLETQREGTHTKHRYTLEEFGLEEAAVLDRTAQYREEFGEWF